MLRHRVTDFKRLLKPEVHDRAGVVSYQRIADILDDHGETELASWVRERLTAVVGPITGDGSTRPVAQRSLSEVPAATANGER